MEREGIGGNEEQDRAGQNASVVFYCKFDHHILLPRLGNKPLNHTC